MITARRGMFALGAAFTLAQAPAQAQAARAAGAAAPGRLGIGHHATSKM